MSEEQKLQDSQTPPDPDEVNVVTSIEENATQAVEFSEPQPKPSLMEVHHHGHVHEQKKWKEYLFQFFMLFLAVFVVF